MHHDTLINPTLHISKEGSKRHERLTFTIKAVENVRMCFGTETRRAMR